MRWPWLLPLLVCLPALGDCSKARGDDFSRFRAGETLIAEGAQPRVALRYRPVPGRDLVYQLTATRRTDSGPVQSRLRLRVALTFPPEGQTASFALRLLTVLRLEPEPPAGVPDLGPTHTLVAGTLGPRGSLDRLEESGELNLPINLTLLAPLLLPAYPEASVGKGGSWRVSRRYSWSRRQGADRLLARHGSFDGRSDALIDTRYTLAREETVGDAALVHIEASSRARLRSRTETLSHRAGHDGTAEATITTSVDRSTGLPEAARISLSGRYSLRAADRTRQVTEQIEVTLTREH